MGRNRSDLTGEVFGDLTAIEFSHIVVYKNNHKKAMWKFQCGLCNNEHIALGSDVKRGRIKSCGCEMNKGSKNGLWKGHEELAGSIYSHYKYNAKLRDILFEITIEDMWNQYINQDKRCPYTNKLGS